MERKNFELAFIVIVAIIATLAFVMAAAPFTIVSPASGTNSSGTLFINITGAGLVNVSVYYNATGNTVDLTGTPIATITNESANATVLNKTIDISSLIDAANYTLGNFTIVVTNYTNYTAPTYFQGNLSVQVAVDNTGPMVTSTNFSSVSAYGNYSDTSSGLLFINVSAIDKLLSNNGTSGEGVAYVFFNITKDGVQVNSTGGTTITIPDMGANRSGTTWFQRLGALNLSGFADGVYNITAVTNDTLNNVNNSAFVEMRIDSVAPVITLTQDTALSTTSKIVFNIAIAGAESGVVGNCNVDVSGVTFTGGGTTAQTVADTDGLSCGESRTYAVTCSNAAGLSPSKSGTFTASACSSGGGSSSSSGSSTTTWTSTVVVTAEQFEEGYSVDVGAKGRLKVKVGNEDHYVGVKSLTSTSATIEIASDPVTVTLDVGEDAKVDVDDDGYYDVYVKLNSIDGSKANVEVKEISEVVPEGSKGNVDTSGDIVADEEGETVDVQSGKGVWLWIILVIVILAVIAWLVYSKKK